MNIPSISIIIPIYNAESYLRKCLDSILCQSFIDFEIILINDGSTDRSILICEEYQRTDKRIKIVNKKNEGVSVARQTGLANAIGRYIIHVDPDDWIESSMLEALYKKAIEDDADMVICDLIIDNNTSCKYSKQFPGSLIYYDVQKKLFEDLHGSCCNKLIKRHIIERYNVRFLKDLTFCEDLYFNMSLLNFPIKISYLPQAFYHYVQNINSNSLVRSYNSRSCTDNDVFMKKTFLNSITKEDVRRACCLKMDYMRDCKLKCVK